MDDKQSVIDQIISLDEPTEEELDFAGGNYRTSMPSSIDTGSAPQSNQAVTIIGDAETEGLGKEWQEHGVLYLQTPDDRQGWELIKIETVARVAMFEGDITEKRYMLFWRRKENDTTAS